MNNRPRTTVASSSAAPASTKEEVKSFEPGVANRRSFLKNTFVAGAAATIGAGILAKAPFALAEDTDEALTKGDAAILRFLAAAEIIESDLWLQYPELGGVQDDEVAKLASKLIPGYPAKATGGDALRTRRNVFTTTRRMN